MVIDAQGVTDGGATLRALAPSEAVAGPPAAAVSSQVPIPTSTRNAES